MREPVSRLVRACLSVCCCAGVVLEIEFPSGIQMMFDFLSLLAINIKSILQVECLGNLSFCAFVCVTLHILALLIVLAASQTRSGRCACS